MPAHSVLWKGPMLVEMAGFFYLHLAQLLTKGCPKRNVTLAQKLRQIPKKLAVRGCQPTTALSAGRQVISWRGLSSPFLGLHRSHFLNPIFSTFLFYSVILVEHILCSSLDTALRMSFLRTMSLNVIILPQHLIVWLGIASPSPLIIMWVALLYWPLDSDAADGKSDAILFPTPCILIFLSTFSKFPENKHLISQLPGGGRR